MEISELRKISQDNRLMREASTAFLLAAAVLGLFVLIPRTSPKLVQRAPVAFVASSTPDAFANLPITAKAAVVYDLTTRKILYAKNDRAQLPLASLTKLLTMYAAFKEFSPTTPITIPQNVMGLSEPHAFTPGQVLPLATLARLTLTGSLNDGAAAIAEATAAQKATNIQSMDASVAASLHLNQTYALNGNGLDLTTMISGGYGSARDVAVLAGAFAALAPEVASATTHPYAVGTDLEGQQFTIKNTDRIVRNVPGLILSKTGYTDLAGGNLALVFDIGVQHPVAVVILGSTLDARFTDAMTLVDATFAHFAGVKSL